MDKDKVEKLLRELRDELGTSNIFLLWTEAKVDIVYPRAIVLGNCSHCIGMALRQLTPDYIKWADDEPGTSVSEKRKAMLN